MLKIKIVSLFVFLACFHCLQAEGSSCEEIDQFVEKLPQQKKNALEYFSQKLVTSPFTSAGYVLYGDKPMCIAGIFEATDLMEYDNEFLGEYGFDFLSELNIPSQNKKFPFVECREGNLRHLIFINRERFIEVVNQNMSLFKFVLGRTLTAETLLQDLLKSGDNFYKVLKSNKLILGILLGYGTQNALTVSRAEDLKGELNDQRLYFPFYDYEKFIEHQQIPSMGFSSTKEEFDKLNSLVRLSTEIKDFNYCPIPHFGCEPTLEETKRVLLTYEKNRGEILKVADGGNVLPKLLNRLCLTVSDEVALPETFKEKHSTPISYKDPETLKKLADCMVAEMLKDCSEDFHFKKESLIEAFLKGAKRNLEGCQYVMPEKLKNVNCDFNWFFHLKMASEWLNKMAKNKDVVELIPKSIYHKVLTRGKGGSLTNRVKQATFNFALYLDEAFVDCGTLKKVQLGDLTPAIGRSLVGMKRGEEREVYIHPKAISGWSPLQSATQILAQIKLLDFEEGESEVVFPQMDEIEGKDDFASYLRDYKLFLAHSYFRKGYEFWEKVKELDAVVDLDKLSEQLRSGSFVQPFENDKDQRKFFLNLNCYKFNCEYEKGVRPYFEF